MRSLVALVALLVGCAPPSDDSPSSIVTSGAPGHEDSDHAQLVALTGFAQVAKEVIEDDSDDIVQIIYVEGTVPNIDLTVEWADGNSDLELYSSSVPIQSRALQDDTRTRGYVVLRVPPISLESRNRQFRLTWYPTAPSNVPEERRNIELALPLDSILSDEILAIAPARGVSSAGSVTSQGRSLSAHATVTLHSADSKARLHVNATVAGASVTQPLADQIAELTRDATFYRGFAFDFVEGAEEGRTDVSFDDRQPDGHIRFERTDSGHRCSAGSLNSQIAQEPTPGVSIQPVSLTLDSVTFEIVATLEDRIVQADMLRVPVGSTEVFWIQPAVEFYRESGRSPVGVAVHVFSEE
jgi:hypothetical protein